MDIRVHHAALLPGPRGEGVWKLAVERVDENGETVRALHVLPADTIEWRVAQFNVDVETAIRMAVVAPYGVSEHESYTLAPTRSEARARKLAIVDDALAGGTVDFVPGKPPFRAVADDEEVVADSGNGNPLQVLIKESPVDEGRIAVKREWMDGKREAQRRRRSEQSDTERPKLNRPTADELRERLLLRARTRAESSGPADTRRGRG